MFNSRFGSKFTSHSKSAQGGGRGRQYLPVTTDLVLWLDGSDGGSITSSSGSVSQWNDKSGNGYHATQGTGSAQPTTGASTQNDKNVLDFATNDTLILPSGVYTIGNGPNTCFVVSKITSETGSNQNAFAMTEVIAMTPSNRYAVTYSSTAGSIVFRSNDGVSSSIADTGNTNTVFNLISCFRSGTTQSISINGATATTNTGGADESGIDAAYIGSAAGSVGFLTGSIGEVIMFNRALTGGEILAVNTYLASKWGITLAV